MGEGYKKAKAISEKLKEEKVETEEKEVEAKEEVKTQLATIQANSELAKMYTESAKVGADNLAGELPLLKVHAAGRSTKNILADGSRPNDGWFYYRPTQEQFQTLNCHILTISKGFRAEGLESKDGEKKEVYNTILGGVFMEKGDYKPFIMYFTGLKLSNLWEFGKEAIRYTKAKPLPIPMFALTVKLTTEIKTNSFGESWVVKFEIIKSEGGMPQLVLDPGEFQFLKDNVETTEEVIVSLIEAKATKEQAEEEAATMPSIDGEVVEDRQTENEIAF